MAQPTIHGFYRVWFTWIDPLVLIPTIYTTLTDPGFLMDNFIPAAMSTPNPDHGFLFHHLAALYAFVGVMLGGTLRVTSDINVWRIITGGVLAIDIALLVSLYVSLKQQGRLEVAQMRLQDWGNLVFTGGVAVIRALFLLGVGVESAVSTKKIA